MIPDTTLKTVKLAARVVDDALQLFYGKTWPKLKSGAIGELTLPDMSTASTRRTGLSRKRLNPNAGRTRGMCF